MFNSMTGFGSSLRNLKGFGKIELQVRSINHRFLEVIFHAPEDLAYLEDVLRGTISKKINRGRISCALRLDGQISAKSLFDETRLLEYHRQLNKLNQRLKLKIPISLELLLSLPGVLATKHHYREIPLANIKELFNRALAQLIQQRRKEGLALYKDVKKRVRKLYVYLAKVQACFKSAIQHNIKRFVSPEEKSNFLKSADITEELVRIKFHLKNFAQEMDKHRASGKVLDFIMQELNRETNTVGAKSIDALVSSYVVKIKSEIDKIREQLQNVE